jgi:predicted nucleic acid-binding protein
VYLLDTNIVSELRKPRPHGAVVAWLKGIDDFNLYLSSVTLGEIQAGIELGRVDIHPSVQTSLASTAAASLVAALLDALKCASAARFLTSCIRGAMPVCPRRLNVNTP